MGDLEGEYGKTNSPGTPPGSCAGKGFRTLRPPCPGHRDRLGLGLPTGGKAGPSWTWRIQDFRPGSLWEAGHYPLPRWDSIGRSIFLQGERERLAANPPSDQNVLPWGSLAAEF